MEIRTERKDGFLVVGMRYVGRNENQEIPELWDGFIPRLSEIPNACGGGLYGVCSMPPGLPEGMFEYVAAMPVSSLQSVPDGMVGRQIPAQTYAVFVIPSLSQIMPMVHRIHAEWLPASSYEHTGGPEFEHYPEDFDPDGGASRLYYYVPVRPRG